MEITKIATHAVNMPLKLHGDVPHVGGQARTALEMLLVRVDRAPSAHFGPGLLASIHVCAAQAQEVWIERFYCDFDVTPLGDAINPRKGRIEVPQRPGLGTISIRTY